MPPFFKRRNSKHSLDQNAIDIFLLLETTEEDEAPLFACPFSIISHVSNGRKGELLLQNTVLSQ